MRFSLKNMPEEVINNYNLHNIADKKEWVCIKIVKGVYGLKQAEIVAYKERINHLVPYGY